MEQSHASTSPDPRLCVDIAPAVVAPSTYPDLTAIHERYVIAADITARNILVAKGASVVKFSDLIESTLLDRDCDMQQADDNGYSMYTDIGQKCDFDLFKDVPSGPAGAVWPRREHLPTTRDIWLGSIIEKCSSKGAFQTSEELSAVLDSATF
ncbi:hypothetical protein AYL99_10821 [Fonsecaea erecta]|uniref:Protein kinase domain-containing protein n=1 Tax=Fonsecaea erecta TaxID=1367422 RepID=A0A178Z6H8_9EURO|nr:hypothetical protein AYL99_10821 [Fonsecaea erecta]OAP55121.1 hypothetical protein AYL99_10821 [Fonsecaea erecta]